MKPNRLCESKVQSKAPPARSGVGVIAGVTCHVLTSSASKGGGERRVALCGVRRTTITRRDGLHAIRPQLKRVLPVSVCKVTGPFHCFFTALKTRPAVGRQVRLIRVYLNPERKFYDLTSLTFSLPPSLQVC